MPPVGELPAGVADLDLSILTLVDAKAFADQSQRLLVGTNTFGSEVTERFKDLLALRYELLSIF